LGRATDTICGLSGWVEGETQESDANIFLALVSEPFGALIIYLEYLKKKKYKYNKNKTLA
jgi:hypothetical protein